MGKSYCHSDKVDVEDTKSTVELNSRYYVTAIVSELLFDLFHSLVEDLSSSCDNVHFCTILDESFC